MLRSERFQPGLVSRSERPQIRAARLDQLREIGDGGRILRRHRRLRRAQLAHERLRVGVLQVQVDHAHGCSLVRERAVHDGRDRRCVDALTATHRRVDVHRAIADLGEQRLDVEVELRQARVEAHWNALKIRGIGRE
jgi:hypothetical protein